MLQFNPIYRVFLEPTPFPWHYAHPSYTFCLLKFIGFHSKKQENGLTVNYMHHNLFSRKTVTLVVSISFSSLWNLLEVMFMHFPNVLYTLVFRHWSAVPHHIRIHCMWYFYTCLILVLFSLC